MRRLLIAGLLLWQLCAPAWAAGPVIAVVIPAGREMAGMDADDIAQVYMRRKLLWPDGRRIEPVNLPADHPLRQRISEALLHQSPESQEEYWNEQYFHGVRPPHVLASEVAVLRFVSTTRNAIGYLSYCGMDAQVRPVLLISGEGRVLPAGTPVDCGAR